MNAELLKIAKELGKNKPYTLKQQWFVNHAILLDGLDLVILEGIPKETAEHIVDLLNGAYVSGMMDLIAKTE